MAPDDDIDSAALCRQVVRSTPRAALATRGREADGWPYASLVLAAADHDAAPLLLISDLAEHTRNVRADDRVALLFDDTVGLDDPLSGPRVTLVGRLAPSEAPRHRDRFLARHPEAGTYAGFGDFHIYRLDVSRVHLVAGFGRIEWLRGEAVCLDEARTAALAAAEPAIIAHMNEDHADAIRLYANRLLGRTGADWWMTGLDPEGADLRRDGETARLPFGGIVSNANEARGELVRLAKQARGAAG